MQLLGTGYLVYGFYSGIAGFYSTNVLTFNVRS